MKLNQFAVYQLKMSAETRKLCFRIYVRPASARSKG